LCEKDAVMRNSGRFLGLAGLIWIVVATSACTRTDTRPLRLDILEDPQMIALDYPSPSYRFDGEGGSLLPTDGWAPAEAGRHPKDTPFFAWALKGRASMLFLRPPGNAFHLLVRAKPFHWEGAPVQVLTARLNGKEIAAIPLTPGWRTYQAAIPEQALITGINELTFEFTYSERPSNVAGSADNRVLSCAFSDIALIPTSAPDPWLLLDVPRIDRTRNVIEIPTGGGFSVPLPGGTQGELHLEAIDTGCPSCDLVVELSDPDGALRQIWSGPVVAAEGRTIEFETPPSWASFLGVRLGPSAEPSSPDRSKTLIRLLPESIQVARADRSPPVSQAPIFLYMIDTLRADALQVYGADPGSSPRTAEFAARAVTYKEAWAPSAWTLPSVSSLFTGLLPSRHGMGLADRKMPGATMPLMARLLSAQGYRTHGISQSFVASAAFGLETGFDRFVLSNQLNGRELRSPEVRRFLLMFLATTEANKAPFVYVHTVDPHSPYTPRQQYRKFLEGTHGKLPERKYRPAPFMHEGFGEDPREVEVLHALYQGEVLFADHQFGYFLDLLQQLALLDPSMVILLSDHGEEFGEHGAFDHGRTLHQEMLRVPLLVQYPNAQRAGTTVEDRVSLLDVLPTVLEVAGLQQAVPDLDGNVLHPGQVSRRREAPIFAETDVQPSEDLAAVDLQAMAIAMTKCIHSEDEKDQFSRPLARWRVYNLQSDPTEQQPLPIDHPTARECIQLMTQWLEARSRWVSARGEPEDEVDEESLEALRALGYIQ
jgi:choline-sulfatase